MAYEIMVMEMPEESVLQVKGIGSDTVSEDFVFGSSNEAHLAFSDGTMLFICFDSETFCWKISLIRSGVLSVTIHSYNDEEKEIHSLLTGSDRVVVDGDLTWYVFGYAVIIHPNN